MRVLTFSRRYLLAHSGQLAAYVTVSMLAAGISILSPYVIGVFLDALVDGGGMEVIARFCAVLGGLSVLKILKGYVTSIIYARMLAKMGWELNRDAIRHVQSLSLSYMDKKDSAYLSQRLSGDSGHVVGFSVSVFQGVLTNALKIAVPFAVLLVLNWQVTLSFLAFLGAYVMVYRFFKAALYSAGKALAEASNRFFQSLFEQLRHVRLLKADSRQAEINRLAEGSFGKLLDAKVRSQKTGYFYASTENVVSTVAQITLFVAGGIQFISGNFTIGMFTVFTSYFAMVMGSAKYFMGLGAAYQGTLVAHDRLMEIFGQKPETNGDTELEEVREIALMGVSFAYETESGASRAVLRDFSCKFERGRIYAVSGENGSGKSTLAGLLLGFYIDELSGGSVLYNGIDIRKIDMVKARREIIGYAEQEPQLFRESLLFNLVYDSDAAVDEARLWRLLDVLGMRAFVEEKGLGFEIDDGGANASGGEKQKIAVLKALYKEPQVLVLDEPTSALDAQSAGRLMEYLHSVKKDRIIVLISHDGCVKAGCDAVVEVPG